MSAQKANARSLGLRHSGFALLWLASAACSSGAGADHDDVAQVGGVGGAGRRSSLAGGSGAALGGSAGRAATVAGNGGAAPSDAGASSGGAGRGGTLNGESGAGNRGGARGGSSAGGSEGGRANGGAGNAGAVAGNAGGSGAGGVNGGRGGSAGDAGGSATSGSGGAGNCMTPPAASPLIGWATDGSGTTGGGNGTPVVVTNASALTSNLSGTKARVVYVSGVVNGSFSIGSNKTLVGVCGAEIHGHLGLGGSTNVIVRNLKIVGNNCTDSPSDCSAGADAITVNSGANHLFFDHLDVSDGSDGNLDITQGSDFVTVAWTKFSYSSKRTDPDAGASGHRFSNLIGASDTDPLDPGHLNVTYHHCWWADNVDQRMPRTRRGNIHVLNNLFTATGNSYCSNAGQDAHLLVENNVYLGVNRPLDITANGDMSSVGNLFQGTSGNQTASGAGFTPPYAYQADDTTSLATAIQSGAGPH